VAGRRGGGAAGQPRAQARGGAGRVCRPGLELHWLCEEGGRENVAPHYNVEYDFYQLTTTETFAHCKGALELKREYAP